MYFESSMNKDHLFQQSFIDVIINMVLLPAETSSETVCYKSLRTCFKILYFLLRNDTVHNFNMLTSLFKLEMQYLLNQLLKSIETSIYQIYNSRIAQECRMQ